MKRPFLQRLIASTVLIGAVLGTASVAQASPNVHVSIGLPGLPVFVQPRAVYQAPPVVVSERPWQPSYRHHAWQSPRYGHDQDRDGVSNRYDRDRDGDGVPNRYDRRPDNPYRR